MGGQGYRWPKGFSTLGFKFFLATAIRNKFAMKNQFLVEPDCRESHHEDVHEPEIPTLTTEARVMFYDTDCAGVVNNISYLRFIETNRTLLAEQLGMGLRWMAENKQYPVVVRTEVDYKRPAVMGDTVLVRGWLESVQAIRFWVGFELTRAEDGVLIAKSKQMLAVVQMPEGRPIRLPEEWKQRFAHLWAR